MFENKKVKGVHCSRYIASWNNAGGRKYGRSFRAWLMSEGLLDEEIDDVCNMAKCGKMELEHSALEFVEWEKNGF